jgi:hypothetical protein
MLSGALQPAGEAEARQLVFYCWVNHVRIDSILEKDEAWALDAWCAKPTCSALDEHLEQNANPHSFSSAMGGGGRIYAER